MSTEAEAWSAAPTSEPVQAEDRWAATAQRSPEPERRRSRSRSPVRMDTRESDDRRDDRGRQQGQGQQNPGNNLHVSGLSTRVEDRDLEELFSKFGRIAKCQVMRDPHTKDSRGFAFVTMENGDEADAAVAALNATELLGRTMNVEKARRGRARTPTPGQYHGPPKKEDNGYRPYEPSRGGYGGGGGGGGGGGYRDDYRGGRDSYGGGGGRDRYDDRGSDRGGQGYAIPMRGGEDRRGGDDRRRDEPRRDDRRPAYDDRRERRPYDDGRGGRESSGGYGGSRY